MKKLLVISFLVLITISLVSCNTGKLTTYDGCYFGQNKKWHESCRLWLSEQDSTFKIRTYYLERATGEGKWSQKGDTIYLHCPPRKTLQDYLVGGVIFDDTIKILVKGKRLYYNKIRLKKIK